MMTSEETELSGQHVGIPLLQWTECSHAPDPYPEPHGDGIRRWVLWEMISDPMNGISTLINKALERPHTPSPM